MFFIIVLAFLIAARVLAYIDIDANGETCVTCLGGAGIFAVVGLCCPDGCCGEYSKKGAYYNRA